MVQGVKKATCLTKPDNLSLFLGSHIGGEVGTPASCSDSTHNTTTHASTYMHLHSLKMNNF